MTTKRAAELYRNMGVKAPADIATPDASKYNARKKVVDGHTFDSTAEARAYQLLKIWERHGAIAALTLQPSFVLQPKFRQDGKTHRQIAYRADFQFVRSGQTVVVDVKGFATQAYKIKRKLFQRIFPEIVFEEWTAETLRRNHA
jgi:hypothetical protein